MAVPEPKGGPKKPAQSAPEKKQPVRGDVNKIKAEFRAARSAQEQDAVIAEANSYGWTDVEYQDLEIFFDTELSKRADAQGGKK